MIGAAISIAPDFCLLGIGEKPLPMLTGKVANDLSAKMKGHLMQVGF